MLVADLTQTLEVTLGRQVPTGAASHRLNDHGGNVAGVVQRQDAVFEFKQQVFLPDRLLVVDVGVVHRVVNETHMVHPRQQRRAIGLAVGRNAAHAHAAETHAVVAALAAYEHIAVAFAARAVVGQRHFERGVCRLRAGVTKQHLVQVAGRHVGDHLGRFEGLVIAGLESCRVVQRVELLFDGFVDGLAVVARTHAPQAGNAV